MRANNLTICIAAECQRACKYCVSKMTWAPEPNERLFLRNLCKARKIADTAQVSSILITSKGEPLLNYQAIETCCETFQDYPLEIQTNGIALSCKGTLKKLYDIGINTIAISIDKYKSLLSFRQVFENCKELGFVRRLTVVLTDMWDIDPEEFFNTCKQIGINQITFRIVTIPNIIEKTPIASDIANWIKDNIKRQDYFHSFLDYFKSQCHPTYNLISRLPFGASLYDIDGISVTIMDYCIQEHNNTQDIRSLIYHQDGHMYTSWDKKGSLIF